jgi:hypothetical protein
MIHVDHLLCPCDECAAAHAENERRARRGSTLRERRLPNTRRNRRWRAFVEALEGEGLPQERCERLARRLLIAWERTR